MVQIENKYLFPFKECIITNLEDPNLDDPDLEHSFIGWKPYKFNETLKTLQIRSQDKLQKICSAKIEQWDKVNEFNPLFPTTMPLTVKEMIDRHGDDTKSLIQEMLKFIDGMGMKEGTRSFTTGHERTSRIERDHEQKPHGHKVHRERFDGYKWSYLGRSNRNVVRRRRWDRRHSRSRSRSRSRGRERDRFREDNSVMSLVQRMDC